MQLLFVGLKDITFANVLTFIYGDHILASIDNMEMTHFESKIIREIVHPTVIHRKMKETKFCQSQELQDEASFH